MVRNLGDFPLDLYSSPAHEWLQSGEYLLKLQEMGLFPAQAAKGVVPSDVLALAGTALPLIPVKKML